MSDVATFGDILAVETQSSETQFWLVQVTARAYRRAQAIRLPGAVTASSEATFEFAGNKPAVKTRRLKPITVARGGNSTRIYEIDEKQAAAVLRPWPPCSHGAYSHDLPSGVTSTKRQKSCRCSRQVPV